MRILSEIEFNQIRSRILIEIKLHKTNESKEYCVNTIMCTQFLNFFVLDSQFCFFLGTALTNEWEWGQLTQQSWIWPGRSLYVNHIRLHLILESYKQTKNWAHSAHSALSKWKRAFTPRCFFIICYYPRRQILLDLYNKNMKFLEILGQSDSK